MAHSSSRLLGEGGTHPGDTIANPRSGPKKRRQLKCWYQKKELNGDKHSGAGLINNDSEKLCLLRNDDYKDGACLLGQKRNPRFPPIYLRSPETTPGAPARRGLGRVLRGGFPRFVALGNHVIRWFVIHRGRSPDPPPEEPTLGKQTEEDDPSRIHLQVHIRANSCLFF